MRRPLVGIEHGYTRYSHGCRCQVCRGAKAAYSREFRARRARARKLVQQHGTGGANFVPGIVHGYSGYSNWSCRCAVCVAAKRDSDATYRRRAVANAQ